jgi:hypothetical protein
VCTSLCWKEKTKWIYDKDAGINVVMWFLCTDFQDDYNHMMTHVDQGINLGAPIE